MILVVGPGRCGTSYVSKKLMDLGINMGRYLNKDNEDLEFKMLNQYAVQDQIDIKEWSVLVGFRINDRVEPWGLKDPRVSRLIMFYNLMLPDAHYIRCHRDKEDVIDSYVRNYGYDKKHWENMVEKREKLLDQYLPKDRTLNVHVDELDEYNFKDVLEDWEYHG